MAASERTALARRVDMTTPETSYTPTLLEQLVAYDMLETVEWANNKLAYHGVSNRFAIVFGGLPSGMHLLDAAGKTLAFEPCEAANGTRRAAVILLMRVQGVIALERKAK